MEGRGRKVGVEGHQHRIYLLLGLACFLFVIYWSAPYQASPRQPTGKVWGQRPNVVLVLTDDQDLVLGGLEHMPRTHTLLAQAGLRLTNAFVASPLCCPSRSSILTGQYVHNHGAINNSLSGQCSGPRWQDGPEKRSFAVHLQKAGYRTYFAGKYLNQYGKVGAGGVAHVPPGWDHWLGLVGNSRYYNYSLSRDGKREDHGDSPGKDYLTDLIRRWSLDFLQEQKDSKKPFFMMLSTPAPHQPFTPQPHYAANFSSLKAPRTPNFNIRVGKEKHWLLRQGVQPLPLDVVTRVDEVFRDRLRTLLSVDDLVGDLVAKLDHLQLLNNTFIFFTSDNGYHLGQFSQPLDKREPYETDIRVPLLVRGPGVGPAGGSLSYPTTNIDLAPTFLDLAGLHIPKYMDGTSLKPFLTSQQPAGLAWGQESVVQEDKSGGGALRLRYEVASYHHVRKLRRTVLVEHWGEGYPAGHHPGCPGPLAGLGNCSPDYGCKCSDSWNNTYACLRHTSEWDDQLFCRWDDQEQFEEAYDMRTDHWQMNNTAATLSPTTHRKLHNLLNNLQRCRGPRCADLATFIL